MQNSLITRGLQNLLDYWPTLSAFFLCGVVIVWWVRCPAEATSVSSETAESAIKVGGPWTVEDVAKHNKEHDIWIVVKDRDDAINKVYNVTGYVNSHPGGDAILRSAGSDATLGFFGPQHPPTTVDLLREYYVGDLKE